MWIEIFALREFLCYNLGNTTLGLYSVFVLVELILHTIRQKRLEKQTDDVLHHANRVNRRLVYRTRAQVEMEASGMTKQLENWKEGVAICWIQVEQSQNQRIS